MKALEKAEGRGSNPYYAGNFDGESDELRDLRLSLVAERDALKAENERLTNYLKKANDQAEDFERRWYLADMELERIKALEPVMVYHGACTIDCGEHGHHDTEMLKMIPAGTKLYALGGKT